MSRKKSKYTSDVKYTVLLLLLLSHFNRVWLCATPETAAHQAPPSLGFTRQEHWSGVPLPSPVRESEKWKWGRSVPGIVEKLCGGYSLFSQKRHCDSISSPDGSHSSLWKMVFWAISDQTVIFICQRQDVECYLNTYIVGRLEAVIKIVWLVEVTDFG